LLEEALKDGNPDVRAQAVQALGLVGPREPYISELEAMLNDKDVAVRLATVASLMDLRNPRTPSALKKALADDVPEVSFSAAKALWNLHEPEGKGALLSVLAGETKTSSGYITKQKRDTFRLIHTPKTMFLFALKEGMGIARVPGLGAGASSLQGILADPSVSGRATTALLLSTDRDPQVLEALRDALSDKDASVRAAAVHAIALRDDPAAVNDLAPVLDDKKEAVRVRAAAALLRLQWIKTQKPKPAPRNRGKKPLSAPPLNPAAK
jgi:HEAT repeat protein